jgi:hypothetical protein
MPHSVTREYIMSVLLSHGVGHADVLNKLQIGAVVEGIEGVELVVVGASVVVIGGISTHTWPLNMQPTSGVLRRRRFAAHGEAARRRPGRQPALSRARAHVRWATTGSRFSGQKGGIFGHFFLLTKLRA